MTVGWIRSGASAVPTQPDQVEAVADAREPGLSGERIQSPIELALQPGGDVEILHSAAPRTHQVMVVTGELLSELVPSEAVLGGNPSDEPCCFELSQVPVG